jgi:hypothetical protein
MTTRRQQWWRLCTRLWKCPGTVTSAPQSRSLILGGLSLPPDFPDAEFNSAELQFRARSGTSPISPSITWQEFSAAWMALAYRFLDVTHFDHEFRESIAQFGTAPEMPEKYRQERLLFGFFVSGLSAIESFCYGLCTIAWEAAPSKLSLASHGQKKGVSPESTCRRFNAHFPSSQVTADLCALVQSSEYAEWVDIRNALAHRASPARKHYVFLGAAAGERRPSEWGAITLDDQTTATRRAWLRDSIATLLVGAGRFASDHF